MHSYFNYVINYKFHNFIQFIHVKIAKYVYNYNHFDIAEDKNFYSRELTKMYFE